MEEKVAFEVYIDQDQAKQRVQSDLSDLYCPFV